MAEFDHDAVSALLNIVEKALGHPKLKPLADAATRQLEAVSAEVEKKMAQEKAEEAKIAAAEEAKKAKEAERVADMEEEVDRSNEDAKHFAQQKAAAESQRSTPPQRRL